MIRRLSQIGPKYNIVVFVLLVVINLQNYLVECVFIMNPGSFTDRHKPIRPAMPAARGEERERARERCTCIYNKVKSYWGPTNE